MKSILITLLLILAAAGIYMDTTGGSGGTKAKLYEGGGKINESIRRMVP